MNRRGFLKLSIGGVATAAAVRTWPFRVYSFPKEIIISGVNGFTQHALKVQHIVNFNAAFEVWMLQPHQRLLDLDGNVIVENSGPRPILAQVPLSRYLQGGILENLIGKEYGWKEGRLKYA